MNRAPKHTQSWQHTRIPWQNENWEIDHHLPWGFLSLPSTRDEELYSIQLGWCNFTFSLNQSNIVSAAQATATFSIFRDHWILIYDWAINDDWFALLLNACWWFQLRPILLSMTYRGQHCWPTLAFHSACTDIMKCPGHLHCQVWKPNFCGLHEDMKSYWSDSKMKTSLWTWAVSWSCLCEHACIRICHITIKSQRFSVRQLSNPLDILHWQKITFSLCKILWPSCYFHFTSYSLRRISNSMTLLFPVTMLQLSPR